MTTLKYQNIKAFGRLLALGASTLTLLYSTNANAAEQVVLKYGNFRGAVSVKELSQFVKTGATTPALKSYLNVSRQDPPVARKALSAGIKANREFLDSLLSSWAGPILLNQVGEVVHPPAKQSDERALRSAMALSISKTGGVSLLEAIRHYPTASVEIEGDRLITVYKRLSELAKII